MSYVETPIIRTSPDSITGEKKDIRVMVTPLSLPVRLSIRSMIACFVAAKSSKRIMLSVLAPMSMRAFQNSRASLQKRFERGRIGNSRVVVYSDDNCVDGIWGADDTLVTRGFVEGEHQLPRCGQLHWIRHKRLPTTGLLVVTSTGRIEAASRVQMDLKREGEKKAMYCMVEIRVKDV